MARLRFLDSAGTLIGTGFDSDVSPRVGEKVWLPGFGPDHLREVTGLTHEFHIVNNKDDVHLVHISTKEVEID